MNCFNPFAPGDFAEKRTLKQVKRFSWGAGGFGGGGGSRNQYYLLTGAYPGVQLVLNKSNGNLRVLSIQPKIPYISVGTSNGMEQFCLHWLDQNIQEQLWRWSSLTGLVVLVSWTEMFLFHFTKLLSPESLFCILFTRTVSKHAVAWIGSVQLEGT